MIKDRFRFASFIIILTMFFVIIFLSIKAYGVHNTYSREPQNYSEEASIINDYSTEYSSSKQQNSQNTEDEIYIKYKIITTVDGDTVWGIAKQYHINGNIQSFVNKLKKVNDLKTEEINFKPGTTLKVPVSDYI